VKGGATRPLSMSSSLSAEKAEGWSRLYLSLADWPDRIREVHRGDNRDRDELTFYLCFFVQSHSLRDWLIKERIAQPSVIDSHIRTDDAMRACRDISNRYKHFVITNPSIDAEFTIEKYFYSPDVYDLTVIVTGKRFVLWDLMVRCISFWEAFVAAYGLGVDQ
jgi:hypothetical protein